MNIRQLLICVFLLLSYGIRAQYLETFATPNKGYQINLIDDLSGVNWTMTPWSQALGERDAADYFNTTAGGVMESIDLDQEVCWESPLLQIGAAGVVSVSVDLTWVGFDTDIMAGGCVGDYIKVLYSVNGGSYIMVPNQAGGNPCATVAYPFGAPGAPFNSSGTITQGGISGSTLRIRVCVFTNANAEMVTIDNVSVPQAGVGLNCSQPVLTTTQKNIVCNGPNSGSIDLSVSGGSGSGYTYDWSNDGPETPDNDPQDLTGLAAGSYTVTVTDGASCTQTTSVTIISSPITQSAVTFPASCGGPNGAIDLTVSGGNPGYTYAWTGGATTQDISGLTAGSYTVTVTDSSVPPCTSTATYVVGTIATGPYSETFSVPNKGYLINQVNNFFGLNWTLSPWTFDEPPAGIGRDNGDYFATTAGGKLEGLDSDQEICWISPEVNISTSGTVQFSVDLTWSGFDNEDYILVQYSINGGAFTTIPNTVGGGAGTIQYAFPSVDQNGSATITQTGLSGNKIQIKVCFLTNSQADIVTIDNVNIPQSVTLCFAPILSTTSTNVSCNGGNNGAIDLTVSGGSSPYTYDWSNDGPETPDNDPQDLTGLVAGTYTVTVTDMAGATSTASVTITQPSALLLTTTQVNVLCNGASTGSIDLTVSGGTSAYSYDWSNDGPETPDNDTQDLTGLAAGAYTVTVSDMNGCTSTASVTITQPAALSLTTTPTNVTCAGGNNGAIDLTVTGGTSGYTYDWSNDGPETPDNDPQDLSGLIAGIYTVTVSDANGCMATTSATIAQPSQISISLMPVSTCTGLANGKITVGISGGVPLYDIAWNGPGANDGSVNDQSSGYMITNLPGGSYAITVTDNNNCSQATSVIVVENPLPICSIAGPDSLCTLSTGYIYSGTPMMSAYSWGISGNASIVGSTTGSSVSVNAGSPGAATLSVTITDSNGCTSSCTKSIEVISSAPFITCPSNVTIECDESTAPMNTGNPVVLDCDFDATVSSTDASAAGNCPQEYTITRTWTAIDGSGQSASCVQIISVEDSTAPSLFCPSDITVECITDTIVANTGMATATDNCDGVPVIDYSDTSVSGGCGGSFFRLWTVTDACGNNTSCAQLITVDDTTPPVITSCPSDVTIECDETTLPANNGTATSSDNCDMSPAVTYNDVTFSTQEGCSQEYLLVRTWIATDDCGNTATCVQEIQVVDTTPPVITCPANLTLECIDDTSTETTGFASATDNCSGFPEVFSSDVTLAGGCGPEYTITRTWTAIDDCGNSTTCVQVISIEDTTPPVITCPANVTVQCTVSTGPANTGGNATATDICDQAPAITFSDVTVAGGCPQERTITRTWTASDDCGNSSTCAQTIVVDDSTPPSILCPSNVTISCASEVPPVSTQSVTSSDNCGPVTVTHGGDVISDSTCVNRFKITRLYVSTDACGNSSSCTQLITVFDNTAPSITCPSNVTIECSSSTLPANTGMASATDNCQSGMMPQPVVWINEIHYDNTGTDAGEFVEVAGTAGVDLSAYSIVLYNGTGGAVYDTDILSGIIDNESNGFGAVSLSYPANGIQNGAPDGIALVHNSTVVQFLSYEGSFTAVGGPANGMVSTDIGVVELGTEPLGMSLRLTGMGTTYANFSWVGPGVQSPGTLNAGQTITAMPPAPPLPVTYTDAITSSMVCPQQYTIARTWSAVDACGNSSSCTQTINIVDTTPPSISCPPNLTLECTAVTTPANTGTAAASDNCQGTGVPLPVIWINELHYDNTGTDAGEFIEVAGTAGLNLSGYSIVLYNGTGGASYDTDILSGVIDNESNGFGAISLAYPSNGIQNGAPDGIALVQGTTVIQFLSYEGTFTAVGGPANGMLSTDIGVLEVGTEALGLSLRLTGSGNTYGNFAWNAPAAQSPGSLNPGQTITVTADPGVSVISSDNIIPSQQCPQAYTINRTWTAEDECGNTSSCLQVITIVDTTPPVITCPPDVTIDFGVDESTETNGTATATDNCSTQIALDFNDVTIEGECEEEYMIERTFTAIDQCGNSSTCLQIVNVDGMCIVDLSLVKSLNPNQGPLDGGDNVQFTITVTNEGEVTVGSVTITDYIPIGFMLNDPDWTPGMAGSTGQSASIVLSIANGGLDGNGLNPFESVSVQITLKINEDIQPGSYANIAEISQVLRPNGVDITDRDIDSDPDQNDTNDPPSEDDQDPAFICILPTPVISGDAYVCPGETTTYFVADYNPDFEYTWSLASGGIIVSTTPQSVTIAWGNTPGGPFQLTLNTLVGPEGCQTTTFLFVYIQGVESLSCNDHVQISLGPDCEAVVLSGMILEGEAEGNNNYFVIITDQNGNVIPNATLTSEHIGQCFTVTVANECNDQSCWGTICVEDKIPPVVECTDVTISCGSILDPVTTAPYNYDACGEVELTYTDNTSGDDCDEQTLTRTWTATDGSGNTSTCIQTITILPLTLDNIVFPAAYVGVCGESVLPDHTGWPTVDGNPITEDNSLCNIFVGYWDKELNDCGGGRKIARTWTVLNWCTVEVAEAVQVIKLSDNVGPELTCPADYEVGTDFWYCYANVSVPKPIAEDECSEIASYSLTSSEGVVVSFGNNYVINGLPVGSHTVTWTVYDECGNSSTCSFNITVVDDVVPVANCDLHTIVSLTNDGPSGITLVPADVFDDGSYDNCGPVTFRARRMDSCIDIDWTTDGACIDDHPGGVPAVNSRDRGTVHRPCVPFACCDVGAGPIMVELEVTDAAGNVNYCMVEAEVQDKISPFVQCPSDIIVSCDFWFNVQEGTFVDGEGNNNGALDEDPLSAVFGNMYDAFRYDESIRKDIIINDPSNEDYSQPHNWGLEGWADDNCEVNLQVRVRIIDDCSGDDLPGNAPDGAVKLIERRFSASDGNEGVAPGTCTQRIWVVDYDPFYITDNTCNNSNPQDGVIWPCDVLLTTCPEDLGNTGEPTIFDDACSLIGVTYEDQRFDFVDGACFKILRTWAVIDWCQYRSDGEGGYYGLWHYTQVIKVHDQDGPEFVAPCETVTLCVADEGVSLPDNNQAFLGEDNPLASSCSVHLNLSRTVHETCSDVVNYDVKLYPYNGTDFIYLKTTTPVTVDENNDAVLSFDTRQNSIKAIRDNGLPYNSQFCGDYHRILWSVEDGCGNLKTCEYLIRLEDCKQPSPVCINGLSTVVMPVGGQVTVWAKDFNASSFDDCTPEADLLYSFSGDVYTPSYTYTCENVQAFGVELSTEIWVADGGTDDNCNGKIEWSERNKDYCTTTIVITDNINVCGDGSGSILAGQVLTEDVQSVEKVGVSINAPGHVFSTYITTQNGQYNFNNVIIPENFTIHAERNDAHRNGVSTLDLVKIQKHLLGIEIMESPYDLIAADANNSQNVSAIDLIELRKLILGIYTELPANKSWRFVDKSFQFADATSPWPFSETINMAGMSGNAMDKDFVAIKVGDVNNTVQANADQVLPRNGNGVVNFIAENRTVVAGEIVDVAIRSADFAGIEGYQFTMDANGLEFRGVEAGSVSMSDENIGVFGSRLTASWHKVGGVNATATDVLFTLHFQATASGKLSEMISLNSKVTTAEAYNTVSDIKDLKLTFRGAEGGAEFALYQNEPNPYKGTTVIGYDLPEAGDVTLTLFDVTGKVVYTRDQQSVKGYNTILLSSKDIPSKGVLYYRLDANGYSATKKMIIIE